MKRICRNPKCNESFEARGKLTYCSKKCRNAYLYLKRVGKIIDNPPKVTLREYVECPYCHVVFLQNRKEQKHCGVECAALALRKDIYRVCEYCGRLVKIKTRRQRYNNIYCNDDCYRNHQKETNVFAGKEKEYESSMRSEISDNYIKRLVCNISGIMPRSDITPEIIEMKRQQIILHRTLKQFKQWRKDNEPNYNDVAGEQRTNEEDHDREVRPRGNRPGAA